MTDERLRELERRWQQSGSEEDEAAWLMERVRQGELEQSRLELAAYCGHQAALLAASNSVREERCSPPPLVSSWVRNADQFDRRLHAIALFLAYELALARWRPSEWKSEKLRSALRDYAASPTDEHLEAVDFWNRSNLKTRMTTTDALELLDSGPILSELKRRVSQHLLMSE